MRRHAFHLHQYGARSPPPLIRQFPHQF
jgi:hypothetical protein